MFPAVLQGRLAVGLLEMPGEMAAVAETGLPGNLFYGLAVFRQA